MEKKIIRAEKWLGLPKEQSGQIALPCLEEILPGTCRLWKE